MNDAALPVGTRLRGGALLIEEVLRREDKAFIYRAHDFPSRREVTLHEYFPENATRCEREVLAPQGWSEQGFAIARGKFSESAANAIFSFSENNTIYLAREYSARIASPHATVALTALSSSLLTSTPHEASRPALDAAVLAPPVSSVQLRRKISWHDILPDALRGAAQGALAGTVGGVLLGMIASMVGDGALVAGAARGLWALPIGAAAGALLGVLRALPANAPQLATASSRTRGEQLQSTLAGAGKGALMGLAMSSVFLLAGLFVGAFDVTATSMLRGVLLFSLSGTFAGAIVGFIRINPRDRSRR
jgi:hypothetical protein